MLTPTNIRSPYLQAIVVRQVGQSGRPEVAAAATSIAQHQQAADGAAAADSVPPGGASAPSAAATAAPSPGSSNGPCSDILAFGLLLPHWDAAQLLYAGVSYDNPLARASNAYFQVGDRTALALRCCDT